MTLTANKQALVDAHRRGDWEAAKSRGVRPVVNMLTPRQTEIVKKIADGENTKEIALDLHISPKTVDYHRTKVCRRLGISGAALLTRFAIREGLIVAGLMLIAVVSEAADLTLAWNPSPSPGQIGYYIYAGTNVVSKTNSLRKVDVGTNLLCSLTDLEAGEWHFIAVAYQNSTNGTNIATIESDPSNELSVYVPAAPVKLITVAVQYNATLATTNWQDMGFFRLKVGMP